MSPKNKQRKGIVDDCFNSVKDAMEQGVPKYIACKKLGINRMWLHRNITCEQKAILDQIYFSFSQGSSATKWKMERKL